MSSNYLKFLLTVCLCLNLFLGYYFIYNFFLKKQENNDDNTIKEKELKIEQLDKINKEKQLLIDSLQIEINKTDEKSIAVEEKIKQNKNDEKNIKIRRNRVNNDDDAALIRELSEQEISY
jgi:septal ring factor EnvC (AmiA/AmiB activator)